MKQDLLGVRKRIGRSGISIELDRTSDGRHSDFAPSVATALAKATVPPTLRSLFVKGRALFGATAEGALAA